MCLILFAVRPRAELPLLVAANRDEFYARPAAGAHFWTDHPHVLAGRDEEAGGTWLGVTRTGRFAAVTHFAAPGDDAPLSRGALPAEFLSGTLSAAEYAAGIEGHRYRGYNLLLWDGEQMVYTSNKAPTQVLEPGYYGLSNAELGAQWPKAVLGAERLGDIASPDTGALIRLLRDDSVPPDEMLPKRGRDLEFERRVAPCFIRGEEYGTRASTAVILGAERVEFAEQLYGPMGQTGSNDAFSFNLER